MISKKSEAELMNAVQRRDRAALECLYDRHAGSALGWALKLLNERVVAEEIVQEAFWRVWRHAVSFDSTRGNFVT